MNVEMLIVIVSMVVVIAILLPFLLDVDSGGFTTNALCTIILPQLGQNVTCTTHEDSFTFIGGNGIQLIGQNKTLIINFTNTYVNATIFNGTGVCTNPSGCIFSENTTAISLGDRDIFKQKVGDQLQFRGLKEGNLINITETAIDEIISLGGNPSPNDLIFYNSTSKKWDLFKACKNNLDIIVFNTTRNSYQCVSAQKLASTTGIDADEWFPSHLSVGGGDDVVVTLSNAKIRTIRFRDTIDSDANWAFSPPVNYQSSNIEFRLYWFIQSLGNGGKACHDLYVESVNPSQSVDVTYTPRKTHCFTPTSVNTLIESTYVFTPAEHGVTNNTGVAILKLTRLSNNNPAGPTGDDLNRDTFLFGGHLRWFN